MALTLVTVVVGAGQAQAAVIPGGCAWSARNTAVTANTALPDTAAVYWTTRFEYEQGLKFIVSGRYLDARYMSFNVYDEGRASFEVPDSAGGPPVRSSLPDYRIAPTQNSSNPWSTAPGRGPDRDYNVVIEEQPSSTRSSLPIAPSGTANGESGAIILRAYRLAGRATLPTVYYQVGGGPIETAQPCRRSRGVPTQVTGNPCGARCPNAVRFRRLPSQLVNTQYPNADTAYVTAPITPPGGGRVIVVRGRAPSAPSGRAPVPWPDPQFQVRYWSMCNTLLLPPFPVVVNGSGLGTTFGCRADEDTRLRRGRYAYVVGSERQRAAVQRLGRRWPGLTFLPFSTSHPRAPHMLVLRNMLPADTFTHATAAVPAGSTPAETARVMGSYYPRGAVCRLSALRQRGPARCGR